MRTTGKPAVGGKAGCWPRVWAARGLLYAWDDRAVMLVTASST
jgi:hypothetical protein